MLREPQPAADIVPASKRSRTVRVFMVPPEQSMFLPQGSPVCVDPTGSLVLISTPPLVAHAQGRRVAVAGRTSHQIPLRAYESST